jgi:hypothetical protein
MDKFKKVNVLLVPAKGQGLIAMSSSLTGY